MAELYIGNDLAVSLKGTGRLEDIDGQPVSGAVVQMTLYEADSNNEVLGATWPIALNDLGSGEYEGQLPAELELVAGELYQLEVVADYLGSEARWLEVIPALDRPFSA